MATERNPSPALTDAQLDDIVDRLLRGRYEKNRPVESVEVLRSGLLGPQTARDYVTARWGVRSRWSSNVNDGLSQAGVTMRSNKLWERLSSHVNRLRSNGHEEAVYRIVDGRTYDTVCYAVGSPESAKQWAWALFGWTLPEGTRVEHLRCELAAGGGFIKASALNGQLVTRLREQVEELNVEIARRTTRRDRLDSLIDSVTMASAHLVSGATVE